MDDLIRAVWRKSSHSGDPTEECLEVADLADGSWIVRNSKDPAGPTLRFTLAEWAVFTIGVRDGKFDQPYAPFIDCDLINHRSVEA